MSLKRNLKGLTFFLITLLITMPFLGCLESDSDDDVVKSVNENDYEIDPEAAFSGLPSGSGAINVPASHYQAAPVTAPLFTHGIDTYVDYTPITGAADAEISDLSEYSAQVALRYWEGLQPEKAIVVQNYSHATFAVPLAVLLDAPILYDGDYTNEALWRLGVRENRQLISIGDTDFDGKKVTVFKDDDHQQNVMKVVEYTIREASLRDVSYDYIIVTNPGDVDEEHADVPGLSSLAGTMAGFRNAIILTCPYSNITIDVRIKETAAILESHGMSLRFLLLMGDAKALNFSYRSYDRYDEAGYPDQNPAASDNVYANFDDNVYTVEVANGRLLAKTLHDMSAYLHRDIHYADYLARDSAPLEPAPTIRHTEGGFVDGWNNNAVVYCAAGAWFDPKAEHYCWQEFYSKAGFNTQDDTPESHTQYGDLLDEHTSILTHDFAMSNFVAIDADHGNKYETVTFNSEDLREMPPNVIFGVSCMLGWTDDVDIQRSMTYTMLEKGVNAFLAATRITFGVISTDTVTDYPTEENDKAGNGLCRLFFEDLIDHDSSVGEAMMDAKNDLMNTEKWDSIYNDEEWEINQVVCWEYECYGDPAFNPYEPNNEGSW